MDTHLDLDELTRSTRRLEFEDGLVDLMNASVFLVVTLLLASIYSTSWMRLYFRLAVKHPNLMLVVLIALAPMMALLLIVSRQIIEHTRRNILWKESGYVKPLRGYVDWRINAFAALVLIFLTCMAAWGTMRGNFAPGTDLRTLAGGVGIATGIIYFGIGKTLNLPRYSKVGFAGGLLSAAIPFLSISFSFSWTLLGSIWAVLLAISGVVGLRRARQASSEAADA
ncbi:MAG: hypothetical protein GTO14_10180 [Anaerolineales bacterium]|nr:hypothetical protein [Anaerolineales bacterium]